MQVMTQGTKSREGIHTFVRNRYFYGKLLDVYHFELEQNYLNGKRWLLNRMVTGHGVLCGLDVRPGPEGRGIIVTPGSAIDKCGREIVVPRNTEPYPIRAKSGKPPSNPPAQSKQGGDCDEYVHVAICFQQCDSDPVAVSVDDCGMATGCSASSIREGYTIEIVDGEVPPVDLASSVPDFLMNGRLNYGALVESVTRGCPETPADCCIPLANIRLPQGNDPIQMPDIDINVRPLVYSNDMLLDIILAMAGDLPARVRGGKQ